MATYNGYYLAEGEFGPRMYIDEKFEPEFRIIENKEHESMKSQTHVFKAAGIERLSSDKINLRS